MKSIIIAFVFLSQIALCYCQSNNLFLLKPNIEFYGYGFYSKMPKELNMPIYFLSADVLNNGTTPQTNVSVNVKIFNAIDTLFNESSLIINSIEPDSIQRIVFDSIFPLNYFPPSINDNYTILFTVNQSETDETPEDNIMKLNFSVTDTVYARDIENNTDINLINYGGTDGDFIGTSYYFPVDNEVNSLSVFIDSSTSIGTSIIGKILIDIGGGNITDIVLTDVYEIKANDIGKWVTIPFVKDGSSEFISQGYMVYVGIESYFESIGDIVIGADSSAIHDFQNETIIRINNVFQSADKVPLVRLNTYVSECFCNCFTSKTDVSCNGGSDGSATVSGLGGVPPYTFLWSNGEATQTATNLSAGIYTVTVTDAFFDELVCSVTITEPSYLSSYISTEGNMLQANAYGGTPPYSYFWFSGDTTQLIPMTDFGCNCAITILDAHNCYTSICPSCYSDLLNSIEINILFNQTTKSLYIENSQFFYLEIYNITGAKLLETKCTEQSTTIDISSFVNGTYIVKAFKDNSFVYRKICLIK